MAGFSGIMKECPICGKLVARELMSFHLWGAHAKPLRKKKEDRNESK